MSSKHLDYSIDNGINWHPLDDNICIAYPSNGNELELILTVTAKGIIIEGLTADGEVMATDIITEEDLLDRLE